MKKKSIFGLFILFALIMGIAFFMHNKAYIDDGENVVKFTLRSENGTTDLVIPVNYLWIMKSVNEEVINGGEKTKIFLQIPTKDVKVSYLSVSKEIPEQGKLFVDERLSLYGANKKGMSARLESFHQYEVRTLRLEKVDSNKKGFIKYIQDGRGSKIHLEAYVSDNSIIFCEAACTLRSSYNDMIWYKYTFPYEYLDNLDVVSKSARYFIDSFIIN